MPKSDGFDKVTVPYSEWELINSDWIAKIANESDQLLEMHAYSGELENAVKYWSHVTNNRVSEYPSLQKAIQQEIILLVEKERDQACQ